MDDDERFDDDEKQRAWLEACRREEAISGLLERSPSELNHGGFPNRVCL